MKGNIPFVIYYAHFGRWNSISTKSVMLIEFISCPIHFTSILSQLSWPACRWDEGCKVTIAFPSISQPFLNSESILQTITSAWSNYSSTTLQPTSKWEVIFSIRSFVKDKRFQLKSNLFSVNEKFINRKWARSVNFLTPSEGRCVTTLLEE